MIFSSASFLCFLAALLIIYPAARSKTQRATVLLVASILFYASWKPVYLILLGASLAVNYVIYNALLARRSRALLTLGITLNLLVLGVVKYLALFVESALWTLARLDLATTATPPAWLSWALPLGISFYTFHMLSALIDVYRGVWAKPVSFKAWCLYVTFFPHLIAGPILRPGQLIDQLGDLTPLNAKDLRLGGLIFAAGLAKKVLLADNLAPIADKLYAVPAQLDFATAWIGTLAFAFQIYFDFSGYSEMAIGLARMFGVTLPRNFLYPYISRNPTEFWRRWHITLSLWLRDYLYISLGGSRGSRWETYRNLMITMLLGGLWHGANWTFVFWGALHGLYLVGWRLLNQAFDRFGVGASSGMSRTLSALGLPFTFVLVCFTWVFFRAPTFDVAWTVSAKMLGSEPDARNVAPGPSLRTRRGLRVCGCCVCGTVDGEPVDCTRSRLVVAFSVRLPRRGLRDDCAGSDRVRWPDAEVHLFRFLNVLPSVSDQVAKRRSARTRRATHDGGSCMNSVLALVVAWFLLGSIAVLCGFRGLLIRLWREPVFRFPILIFESDDWSPGPETDAIALRQVADVLRVVSDRAGRHPVMTLGLVLAVPDCERIVRSDFQEYGIRLLSEPPYRPILDAIASGAVGGVFSRQLHGREHYWPPALISAARSDGNIRGLFRNEHSFRTEELPPSLQARWVDCSRLPSARLAVSEIESAVGEEVRAFSEMFGESPLVVVPPTFVWNDAVEAAWARSGISTVVTPGRRYEGRAEDGSLTGSSDRILNGDTGASGVTYLVRDQYFEPSYGHTAERAVDALRAKTACGRPTLLEIHRFNFIGSAELAKTAVRELAARARARARGIPEHPVRFEPGAWRCDPPGRPQLARDPLRGPPRMLDQPPPRGAAIAQARLGDRTDRAGIPGLHVWTIRAPGVDSIGHEDGSPEVLGGDCSVQRRLNDPPGDRVSVGTDISAD